MNLANEFIQERPKWTAPSGLRLGTLDARGMAEDTRDFHI